MKYLIVILVLLGSFSVGLFGARAGDVPVYSCRIVNNYPHDKNSYTQGLVFDNGVLYESLGRYGSSALCKVELSTGKILRKHKLTGNLFGEGITVYKDKIIQLTWRARRGFVYDKGSFELLREFYFPYEGWGITYDGALLVISDGSSIFHLLNPETFQETGKVAVHDDKGPVLLLNELEYIKGRIYANVWRKGLIAIIGPQTGRVEGWIDLKGVLSPEDMTSKVDVPNGIAYDEENDRLFVTGKLWPKLFEIKLVINEKLSEE